MNNFTWPCTSAFINIADIDQELDGKVRCTAIAICDQDGYRTTSFHQGGTAHFFHEWKVLETIDVPSGGVEIKIPEGREIRGRNSFQDSTSLPLMVEAGKILRFHHEITLDLSPGRYFFSLELASATYEAYKSLCEKSIGHNDFRPKTHGRIVDAAYFEVTYNDFKQLKFHRICGLRGSHEICIADMPTEELNSKISDVEANSSLNTLLHITHWKAGSQWIHKLLIQLAGHRIISPNLRQSQFSENNVKPGFIYPTLYLTASEFNCVRIPKNAKKFIIFRDLRDTLVSAYFSIKFSHPQIADELTSLRSKLHELDNEGGMLYLLREWLPECAAIQLSWIKAGERFIRYEDLLLNDAEILKRVLLDDCGLEVSAAVFDKAIVDNRFENLTKGRARGEEDIHSHERKGVEGDWVMHFTPLLKDEFKRKYGGLLVLAEYEKDLNW